MVVVDKEGDDAFVVMDLDQYEALLDTQPEFDEDFNKFIEEDTISTHEPVPESDIWDVMQKADGEGETWDLNQLSEEELADLEKQYKEFADKHVQEAIVETQAMEQIPEEVSKKEKESDDDEYGEEQFYLEPIE